MTSHATIKKRLSALEIPEGEELQIFLHSVDEFLERWDPMDPKTWTNAHPNGHAVILEIMDCRE